jgi:hypothetical protein
MNESDPLSGRFSWVIGVGGLAAWIGLLWLMLRD